MVFLKWLLIIVLVIAFGPLYVYWTKQVDFSTSWQHALNGSSKMTPPAEELPEALIQVYAARTFNWRGLFAVHAWFAIKPAHAKHFTTYQVIGWNLFRGKSALTVREDFPDRYWYGNKPSLVYSLSGPAAEILIPAVENAIKNYPYKNKYSAVPGPNSNTFIAYVARQVPQLGLTLPPIALGQDYLGEKTFFAKTPSGSGYQLSLWGLLGLTVAKGEGVRITFLGLTLGISFKPLAIIYPAIGFIPSDL